MINCNSIEINLNKNRILLQSGVEEIKIDGSKLIFIIDELDELDISLIKRIRIVS